MIEAIKMICMIVGAVCLGVIAAGFLLIIFFSIASLIENRRIEKKNRENGNLQFTVDMSWKEKMK